MLLIDAIAIVESGGKNIPGDHGAALSRFQIHRGAWEDVKKRFGRRDGDIFLDVGDQFESIAGDDLEGRMRARNAATGYVFLLEERLKRHGHEVTPENIYACWNLGFDGFVRRHFMIALCPRGTAERARRVAALCNAPDPPLAHHVCE